MVRGNLCCVGTSATLGGANAASDLVDYASEIFDEDFEAGSIIVEERKTAASYLEDIPATTVSIPDGVAAAAIMEKIDGLDIKELLAEAFRTWFQAEPPENFDALEARLALGKLLDGHLFFQTILKILKGRPTVYADVRSELRRNKLYATLSLHVDAILYTLTALVAHARRIDAESGDATSKPVPAPFFNVRHQIWICELARMVASIDAEPRSQALRRSRVRRATACATGRPLPIVRRGRLDDRGPERHASAALRRAAIRL